MFDLWCHTLRCTKALEAHTPRNVRSEYKFDSLSAWSLTTGFLHQKSRNRFAVALYFVNLRIVLLHCLVYYERR